MNAHKVLMLSGLLTGFAAIVIIPAMHMSAQPPNAAQFRPFSVDGFQATASSSLLLHGDPIGNNATWQRVLGPSLGSPFGMIPSVSGSVSFNGASCRAEYSQDQIVTANKGTLNVNVWGYRCEPFDSAAAAVGAHVTNGAYSIQGGTGQFQDVAGGTGSIQIETRSDGSTLLRIAGSVLRRPDAYRPF